MKKLLKISLLTALAVQLVFTAACAQSKMPQRKFISSHGKGYLEKVGSQLVLHLKGSPREMGEQHGTLLRTYIQQNVANIEKAGERYFGNENILGKLAFYSVWQQQLKYLPERYIEEMKALAEASGLEFERIRDTNTLPEFFHCSGFAVFGKATTNGELLHGRILDYGVDMGLQEHAVVIISEPDGYVPFVNIGYAGFVGSVTGMNLKQIGFGEMGGKGQGKWDGLPMSFLMRQGLEECHTLKDAIDLFQNSKRTCEYYYVLSDANIPSAVAVSATPESIEFIGPNQASIRFFEAVEDAVLISGGERYRLLVDKIKSAHGKISPQMCFEIMKRPVAMKSCLHTALMAPKSLRLWVAHATPKGEPASEQPYTYLDIKELMGSRP